MMNVNCWHMNERESAAMWGLYQHEGRGVAVKSTLGGLKKSVACDSRSVYVARVNYIDYAVSSISEANIVHRVIHKRQSFAHEQELRMIAWSEADPELGERQSDGTIRRKWNHEPPPGVAVSVLLDKLIHSIHVAPDSPEWFVEVVRESAAKGGIAAPVRKSEMDDPAFF